jgi:hypothetical protein
MSDDDMKSSKEESKRPGASQWVKSKKERVGEETHARIPVSQFLAPPKTPISSKLRKNAQAKALAAYKVTTAGESKILGGGKELEVGGRKIKKKKRTEEEEEEDERDTAEVRTLLKEQNRLDYEDAVLDMEESDTEDGIMSSALLVILEGRRRDG